MDFKTFSITTYVSSGEDLGSDLSPATPGYCYLKLYQEREWSGVARQLGPFPTWGAVRSLGNFSASGPFRAIEVRPGVIHIATGGTGVLAKYLDISEQSIIGDPTTCLARYQFLASVYFVLSFFYTGYFWTSLIVSVAIVTCNMVDDRSITPKERIYGMSIKEAAERLRKREKALANRKSKMAKASVTFKEKAITTIPTTYHEYGDGGAVVLTMEVDDDPIPPIAKKKKVRSGNSMMGITTDHKDFVHGCVEIMYPKPPEAVMEILSSDDEMSVRTPNIGPKDEIFPDSPPYAPDDVGLDESDNKVLEEMMDKIEKVPTIPADNINNLSSVSSVVGSESGLNSTAQTVTTEADLKDSAEDPMDSDGFKRVEKKKKKKRRKKKRRNSGSSSSSSGASSCGNCVFRGFKALSLAGATISTAGAWRTPVERIAYEGIVASLFNGVPPEGFETMHGKYLECFNTNEPFMCCDNEDTRLEILSFVKGVGSYEYLDVMCNGKGLSLEKNERVDNTITAGSVIDGFSSYLSIKGGELISSLSSKLDAVKDGIEGPVSRAKVISEVLPTLEDVVYATSEAVSYNAKRVKTGVVAVDSSTNNVVKGVAENWFTGDEIGKDVRKLADHVKTETTSFYTWGRKVVCDVAEYVTNKEKLVNDSDAALQTVPKVTNTAGNAIGMFFSGFIDGAGISNPFSIAQIERLVNIKKEEKEKTKPTTPWWKGFAEVWYYSRNFEQTMMTVVVTAIGIMVVQMMTAYTFKCMK